MRRLLITSFAVALGAISVAGCSDDGDAGPATFKPASVSVPSGDVAIKEAFDGFQYYGACGNETVLVGETTFYPLLPDELARLDESRYASEAPPTTGAKSGLAARVVPPGPGDDVGTMLVFEDGIARFESESGRVRWLTDQEHTYNWEC